MFASIGKLLVLISHVHLTTVADSEPTVLALTACVLNEPIETQQISRARLDDGSRWAGLGAGSVVTSESDRKYQAQFLNTGFVPFFCVD